MPVSIGFCASTVLQRNTGLSIFDHACLFLKRLHCQFPQAFSNGNAIDLPEDGVTAIQMRLRRVRDEKLAAASVFARESHSDRAASIALSGKSN